MWVTGAYGYLSDYVIWWLAFVSILFNAWCFFRFHALAPRPRARLIAGNLLVGLCLSAAACMASETYLRFVSIETDAYGASMTTRRWKTRFASRTGARLACASAVADIATTMRAGAITRNRRLNMSSDPGALRPLCCEAIYLVHTMPNVAEGADSVIPISANGSIMSQQRDTVAAKRIRIGSKSVLGIR